MQIYDGEQIEKQWTDELNYNIFTKLKSINEKKTNLRLKLSMVRQTSIEQWRPITLNNLFTKVTGKNIWLITTSDTLDFYFTVVFLFQSFLVLTVLLGIEGLSLLVFKSNKINMLDTKNINRKNSLKYSRERVLDPPPPLTFIKMKLVLFQGLTLSEPSTAARTDVRGPSAATTCSKFRVHFLMKEGGDQKSFSRKFPKIMMFIK